MDSVQFLVVVHCHSGMANAAAEAIDVSEMPGVVGTISGDNTLLVIAQNEQDVATLMRKFERMKK